MISIIENRILVLDNNWGQLTNFTLSDEYGYCDRLFKDMTNEVNPEFFAVCFNYSYSH